MCTCAAGENSAFWLWYSRCACHPPLQPWIVTNAEIPAASVRRDVAQRPPGNADKIALKGLLGNVFWEERNGRVSDAAGANIGD